MVKNVPGICTHILKDKSPNTQKLYRLSFFLGGGGGGI